MLAPTLLAFCHAMRNEEGKKLREKLKVLQVEGKHFTKSIGIIHKFSNNNSQSKE
jgi:hypothetical protein